MDTTMKRSIALIIAASLIACVSCKKRESYEEPNAVLQKWAKSIEQLNYSGYASTEAYPKSDAVFREMYRDYYMMDVMATEVEPENPEKAASDQSGEKYLHRSIHFEGTIINRQSRKPTGVMRGEAVFVRFLEGKRRNDGWLISNRILTQIDR